MARALIRPPAGGVWQVGRIGRPFVAYVRRYGQHLANPFPLLVGQVLTFFGLSLYVKLVEMRLTPEYAAPWHGGGEFLTNSVHYLRFCGQEIALTAGLLVFVAVWRRCDPDCGRASRWLATVLGLVVLPLLSVIEILGLAHFALFLTPLGPEEIRQIAWARHIVSASNTLELPQVTAGLILTVAGYYLVPVAVCLPRICRRNYATRMQIVAALALGVAALLIPPPMLTDALLEPQPVLWLLLGNRSTPAWADTAGTLSASGTGAGRARFTVKQHPKNVLIFILESTRAESVALYNPAASAGRGLLRLRDEIVTFDQVYAPVPTSAHALFSILYGVYPYLGPFWSSADKSVIADSMAELFQRAGYATHMYITSDLDYDNVRSFVAPGFDRVLDQNAWPGQESFALLPWGRDDQLLIDEIKRFIVAKERRPFFLVAMTSNPHHPYAIEQLPGQQAVDDAHVAYELLVDYDLRLLADLYTWMKRRGVADDTLILVLGDHGEAFGEHAGNYGHAAFIYEENVHIPCFILHPRRLGLPRRISQLGSEVDLRATILDILGRTDSESGDGMSLLREDPRRMIANFTENGVSRFGVRDTQFTYIYTPHIEAEQVFDRQTDSRETRDIASQQPGITAAYRSRLQRWEAQHELSLAKVLR
jgi:arylsulfatase A-like enzyme